MAFVRHACCSGHRQTPAAGRWQTQSSCGAPLHIKSPTNGLQADCTRDSTRAARWRMLLSNGDINAGTTAGSATPSHTGSQVDSSRQSTTIRYRADSKSNGGALLAESVPSVLGTGTDPGWCAGNYTPWIRQERREQRRGWAYEHHRVGLHDDPLLKARTTFCNHILADTTEDVTRWIMTGLINPGNSESAPESTCRVFEEGSWVTTIRSRTKLHHRVDASCSQTRHGQHTPTHAYWLSTARMRLARCGGTTSRGRSTISHHNS